MAQTVGDGGGSRRKVPVPGRRLDPGKMASGYAKLQKQAARGMKSRSKPMKGK